MVVLANCAGHFVRYTAKHIVADQVPVGVVDAFEEIQINKKYTQWCLQPLCPTQFCIQQGEDASTIPKVQQGIMRSLNSQCLIFLTEGFLEANDSFANFYTCF